MPTCPTQQLFSLLSLPSSSVCHPLSEVSGDLTGSGATAHPQEASRGLPHTAVSGQALSRYQKTFFSFAFGVVRMV